MGREKIYRKTKRRFLINPVKKKGIRKAEKLCGKKRRRKPECTRRKEDNTKGKGLVKVFKREHIGVQITSPVRGGLLLQ